MARRCTGPARIDTARRTKMAEGDAVSRGTPAAHCPSCERFIGPADVCPYCGANSAKPPLLRLLRYAALALALIGLFFLYLMARHRNMPVVKAGEISPMMNFATVRVVGKLARKPYTAYEDGQVDYLSFLVDDGSGKVRVQAYGDVARLLVASNLLPRVGTMVDVTGSIKVSAGKAPRLRLLSSSQVRVGDEPAGKTGSSMGGGR